MNLVIYYLSLYLSSEIIATHNAGAYDLSVWEKLVSNEFFIVFVC